MSSLRPGHLETPHRSRLAPTAAWYDQILVAHAAAVAAGHDTYRDPRTGYQVFTAACLAARGTCCAAGCRHCPYVGA